MIETNKVYEMEAMELLKQLPDKSVDLVLCDLPYGTTACSWDEIIPLNILWEQYLRIIKPSGNIVLTASQPFTSFLIFSNPLWFSHSWIWEKEQGVNFLCSSNQPLKIHEDILVFRKPDNYGVNCFIELREYFREVFNKLGLSKKQIMDKLGQGLDHCFRFNSNQWGLPTEKNYNLLEKEFNLKLKPFNELKQKYTEEFFRVYNPQKKNGKPYISGKGNSGEVTGSVEKIQTINIGERLPSTILRFNRETGLHPTQKPVALFEYLIKTYSNKGDLVVDNCVGSGTTAVACKRLNRNFICCDNNANYVAIANKRLAQQSVADFTSATPTFSKGKRSLISVKEENQK